jgi:N-methylhydantoinase B
MTATRSNGNGNGALGFDPVDVEIFQRSLYDAANEMGLVMIRTSGSPVIGEAVDFSTFIADAKGEIISFSGYMTMHLGPARQTVKHIVDVVDPADIHPGDAFIANDPHTTGACHPPDVGVVRPIFAGDEIVAWCWAEAHLLDVGGMSPGGFAPGATECYGEALRFPGIKIMIRGKMIDDIRRLIMANFRMPVRNLNDIRCFIAACNVCDERLQEMLQKYGADTFKEYSEISKDLSEKATRKRIASLPDGTYTDTKWVEHNGHRDDLFKVQCAMTVEGDDLTIDFTGSSPQTDGFVNLSLGGTVGSALTPLMCTLVPDIPFNEGVIRALEIIAPAGTITNVQMPAPVSSGHMETGMNIAKAMTTVLAEAQAASDDQFVREHAMAPFHDAWIGGVFYAPDESDQLVVFLDMNGGGAGGGAQTVNDGMDASATFTQLNNGLPDIEVNELQTPILYLWRRLNADSGGPGTFRGGQGIRFAWTPWRTVGGQEHVFSACWHVPPAGVFGGYPGSASAFRLASGAEVDKVFADGRMPADIAELAVSPKMLVSKTLGLNLVPGDVFIQEEGGGAGLGDPLERSAAQVARDVGDGYVSPEAALSAYGVIIGDDASLDSEATERERGRIRDERRGWPRKGGDGELERLDDATPLRPLQLSVGIAEIDGGEVCVCERCRSVLGDAAEGFRAHATVRETEAGALMAEIGGYAEPRSESPYVHVLEHACPGCGTLLAVDVVVSDGVAPTGEAPLAGTAAA